MNDIQQLEKTISDLMITINQLQSDINVLNKTNKNLELAILTLSERVSTLE